MFRRYAYYLMMSTIEMMNYNGGDVREVQGPDAVRRGSCWCGSPSSQRANLPALAAELELSPAQCHLLNLIEPESADADGRTGERALV